MIINYIEAVIALAAALLFAFASGINLRDIMKFKRPSLTRWSTYMLVINMTMAIALAVYAAFLTMGGFHR